MTNKVNEIKIIEKLLYNILGHNYRYIYVAKELTDKFHIIPKTDSPEKRVEMPCSWCPQGIDRKLKWKEDK